MNSSALSLTIAIPVKNEEKNLPGCLQAIGRDFASKVVIIDSGSTDATIAIAKSHGVEVIPFSWNGQFPKKRNWYLRYHTPATEWVLFLDADEYISEAFKQEVRAALSNSSHSGYWLKYSIHFLGKKLRGGYPLHKLGLFRVGTGEYERIDEDQWSHLDMEIHEHPILQGSTGQINTKIDHRDFRGVSHYVTKHNEYSDWEARRYIRLTGDNRRLAQLTWKQRIKYRLMSSIWIGPVFFFGSFVFMGGFRDGSRGFAFAMLKAGYFTQIYVKIRELRGGES